MERLSKFLYDPNLVLYVPLRKKDVATTQTFTSSDGVGHMCTNTNAEWGQQGYYFNGVSSKIDCGTNPLLNFGAGSFTVMGWFYYSTSATDKPIFGSTDAADRRRICLRSNAISRHNNADTHVQSNFSTDSYLGCRWNCITGTYSADDSLLSSFNNGILNTETGGTAAATGTLDPATDNWIGANRTNGAWWFGGTIGEVWVFNRALVPVEIRELYFLTKTFYR